MSFYECHPPDVDQQTKQTFLLAFSDTNMSKEKKIRNQVHERVTVAILLHLRNLKKKVKQLSKE